MAAKVATKLSGQGKKVLYDAKTITFYGLYRPKVSS